MGILNIAIEDSEVVKNNTTFSICSIVNNIEQYQVMLSSFRDHGFSQKNSEFFYINNSKVNKHDCFHGLNKLMGHCTSRYLILCHQDIVLLEDDANDLLSSLKELDKISPNWAVAGNAGVDESLKLHIMITDIHGNRRKSGSLPASVSSLDENFLVLKRSALLGFSSDLSGFHMYGTDICIQAALRGYSCHVINFHLHHLGRGGYSESFFNCTDELEKKYSKAFRRRKIRTTCTRIFVGATRFELFMRYWIRIIKRKERLSRSSK